MANINDLFKQSFGQFGCAFQDTNAAVEPPSGMVIIAIQFLAENTLTGLVAEDSTENSSWGLTSGQTGAGSGGVVIDSSNKFPAGLTIFGRWTSVTPTADADGGIICYFGPK